MAGAAIGLLAMLMAAVPVPGAAAGCGSVHGEWTRLPIGEYPQTAVPSMYGEHRETTAYAVDPVNPARMWVTNSKSVLRTVDGGCSWQVVYALPVAPADTEDPGRNTLTELDEIGWIAVPATRSGGDRVYLGVRVRGPLRQDIGAAVVRSDDGGTRWSVLRGGLPPQHLRHFTVAPSDPDRLYAVFTAPGKQPPSDLYVSDNGGRGWTARGGFAPPPDGLEIRANLTVDPLDADSVWGWGDARNQLYHSTGAGRAWRRLEFVNEPLSAFGVFSAPGQHSRVVGLEWQATRIISSDDGGVTWRRRPAPSSQYAESVVFGRTPDGLALLYGSMPGGVRVPARVYRYDADADRFADITPKVGEAGQPELYDLRSDATPTPRLYAREPHAIWRYHGPLDPAGDDAPAAPLELPFGLRPVPPTPPKPATLAPARTSVRLAQGESATVDYQLRLPRRPTPLDLGILIDTSGSMGPSIRSLREQLQGIVTALARQGVRLRVGLADYKEYEDVPPYSGTEGGRGAYFLRRDLGAVDEELANALGALVSRGGGTGEGTPALAALYQLATGEGQQVDTRRPSRNDIEPGQQLNYHADAMRVVLHVADAPYREGEPVNPAYPAPSVARTIAALTERSILHVGIAVDHGPSSAANNGRASLTHLARETGALAANPVDCDGDGTTDVRPGEPLVCTVSDDSPTVGNAIEAEGVTTLAGAILGVLRSVRDEGSVLLVSTARAGVVTTADPEPVTVDVTEGHHLRLPIRITCRADAQGQTDVVTVGARLNTTTVATAQIAVECGTVPVALEPGPPPAKPAEPGGPIPNPAPSGSGPAAALGPAAPPPPAPIPVQAPAPGTASAPGVSGGSAPAAGTVGQGQPGAALAPDEQDQGSLATAGTGSEKVPHELLASDYVLASRRPTGMPLPVFYGAALLTAAATAWALCHPAGRRERRARA